MTKTAIITGAAKRIGREIALSLADIGYDIAIHYDTSENEAGELAGLIKAKNRKAYLVKADFLCYDYELSPIILGLNKQGIKIDCLINNAAVFWKDSIFDINEPDNPLFWQQMTINLTTPLVLIKEFAQQYTGKAGNIINICDGMSGWSISPKFLSYSLSKMGLENATKLLASELAPNIRINAIAAGASLIGKQDEENTFAKLEKIIPLQIVSSPEEICNTVKYILATPSLTGQVIALSGGMR